MATTEVPTESQECDVCGGSHQTEYCPELGLPEPWMVIEFVSRERLTLPEGMQIIEMTDGSLGISSKVAISPKTQFGPFEAKRTNCDIEAIDFFILKMFNKDGSITCYDASDENECNWMCFIRPADTSEEQNCMAYRIGQNVFYSVTREIQPEEELRVWYAPHYAKKLGRDPCPNGATRTMLGALLITEQPEPAMKTELREEEEGEGEGEGTEEGTEEKPVPIHRKNITESQSPENINRLEQDKASKITHENRKVGSTNNSLAKTPQKAMVTKTPETNREEQDLRATNVGGTNSLAGTQQNTIETQTPVKRSRGRPPKSKNKRPNFHYVPAETVDSVPILPDIKVGDSSGRRILPHRAVKGVRTTGKLAENDDSFLSPRKAKGGKVPSQGHQKKGRGRPRKLDVDSEVGQIGGEDDGKDSDGVEDGDEEVMGDEEEEEFVDDAEDADFKPPNRIKKNEEEEEDEENEIDEQDENLEDEDTYKERSRGKTPHKKRQRRKMKDEEEEEGEGEGEGTEEGTEEKPVPIHRKNITESQSPENINRLEQDKASKITHENRKVGSTNNSLAKTPQKAMVTKTPETNREEQDLRATNVGGTNSLAGTQQNTIETQTPVKRSRGRPPKSKNKRPNFHYVPAETVDPVPILPDIKVGDSSGRRILPHRAVKGVRTTGKLAENDDSFLSPRKAKGGKVPSQGHQKKGRGRPRKLDVDSEVGQIGGEDDGKDSDGVEDGDEEVMGDEEEEEFVDDAEDADFKPPNRIKKNEEEEEDEENEIDEQDENLEDEDTYKERSRGKTPHKKRQRRKMKDEEEEEGEGEGEGTEEGTEEKPVPIHRKNITESQSPENINRLEQDKASKITHENRKVGSTNNSLAKTPQKAMVTKTPETNREEQDLRATNVGGTNSLAGTQQNTIETQTPVKRSRGRPPKSKNKRPNFHYVPAETVDPVPILPDIKVGDSSGRRILPHRAVKGVRTTGKLAENDDSFLSPRKAKGGKVPSQGHQKKGRGRPRKLDVDSEVGQIGGEDDGKDSDGVEDGDEEVMGDEEEEEFVDDAEDADFKPPNRIKKNEEDEENEIDEQDENLEDEDTYKERSRGKTPHKKRQRRKMKDEEILALEELTSVTYSEEGEKLYNCGKCGKQFTQRSYLRLHLPAHTDRYKCKDCCKRFTRNESFQKHQCLKTKQILYMKEKQQESDPDIYCCAHCHKEFTQEDYVIKHFSLHTSKLKCPQCGVLFPAEGDLAKHLETECQKSTEKEFPCTICKQSFKNEKYLYRHMAMHTDIHKCEKCGKCYSRKDSWQTHMLRCMPETLENHQIFVCTNCKKTFATQLGANNHMANCARHFCAECKTAFQSPDALASHECHGAELNKNITIQFQCTKCGKSFSSITYLNRHQASHQGAFECPICHKHFSRKEEHSSHYRFCLAHSKIAEVGEIDCEICKLIFKDSKEYRDHYQTHTHPFQCTLCFKRFIKIGTLHNHKCDPLMLDESSSVVQCNICQKRFKGEKYLLRHQIIHSEPNFECEFCHRKFFRKDYLSDHVCSLPDGTKVRMVRKRNRVHVRENLVCHLCGRPFTSVSNLNKHMKIHGEKKFSCKICHKKFHFENYVKIHTEMVHEKKFRYQCSYCGKVVTSKAGLMCHIRQFHTTNAPVHKCPKCNKEFRQRGNLKTHMFSHDDEKKFVCTFCSKAFKYPEQLKRHTLEHTMVTKLACKRCDKKFVRMYDLKRHHLNYHSGIIYVCVLCHERCAHRHTMVRHFRRKHPQNMHLVQNPATLDEMRRQSDVAATIKEEPGETTILLETVDQLDSAMTDCQGSTQIILPHNMAAEALQDLSNAVVTTDQLGQETLTIPSSLHSAVQTVQAVESIDEDDQTVVILQIINPGEQDITEEVIASIEGVEFIQQEADGEHHSNVTETIEIQPEGVDETVGDETMTVVAGDQAASQPEAVVGGEETLTDIATDETITETTVDDGPTTG